MREEISARLAAAIREAMLRENVPSLLQLADALKKRGHVIQQQDLSAWSTRRVPDLDRLPKIGAALGVAWQWLLVGDLVPRVTPVTPAADVETKLGAVVRQRPRTTRRDPPLRRAAARGQ